MRLEPLRSAVSLIRARGNTTKHSTQRCLICIVTLKRIAIYWLRLPVFQSISDGPVSRYRESEPSDVHLARSAGIFGWPRQITLHTRSVIVGASASGTARTRAAATALAATRWRRADRPPAPAFDAGVAPLAPKRHHDARTFARHTVDLGVTRPDPGPEWCELRGSHDGPRVPSTPSLARYDPAGPRPVHPAGRSARAHHELGDRASVARRLVVRAGARDGRSGGDVDAMVDGRAERALSLARSKSSRSSRPGS